MEKLSRRRLVSATAIGVAGGLASRMCFAADFKMTKQRAEYQDTPKDIYACASCALFEKPTSCKVVEGDVSPDGWCNAYVLMD